MQNRAKCKLCETIIHSFHSTDYVECKCGEICVDGGEAMRCAAKNWDNFLRVDDKGNNVVVTIKGEVKPIIDDKTTKPTKKELIGMLDEMIKNIEGLPEQAMITPVNHYDLLSALMLVASILKYKK